MLGSCSNETVGKTRADFMTRFYLSSLSVNLKQCTLDSMCLEMYERPQYTGDTLKSQTIKIYELTEDLTVDHCKEYFEDLNAPFDLVNSAQFLGEKSYKPRTDTTSYFSYKFSTDDANDIYSRIKSVFNDTLDLQTVDSMLIKKFKGLYITTDYEDAAIVNYAPQLSLYVHDADSSYKVIMGPSATSYTIDAESDISHVYLQELNVFYHDFSQDIIDNINVDTDVSYVQGFIGLKTLVSLAGLDSWQDSAVVFNSVKLHVPFYEEQQATHFPYNLPKIQIYSPSNILILSVYATTPDSSELVFNLNGFMTYLKNNSIPASEFKCQIVYADNNVYGNILALDTREPEKVKLKIVYSK